MMFANASYLLTQKLLQQAYVFISFFNEVSQMSIILRQNDVVIIFQSLVQTRQVFALTKRTGEHNNNRIFSSPTV